MGLLSLNLPVIGQSSATEDQKVRDALAAIQTDYNGNVTDANIAAAAGIQQSKLANGATGMAIGAFRAYRNAAAALAAAAVVVFDTDTGAGAGFDISSWYDTATGRFTPQVAGYYRLSWRVASGTAFTVDNYFMAGLYKNGVPEVWAPPMNYRSAASGVMSASTDVVVANGTTDFFDVRIDHNNAGTVALTTGIARTAFAGHLIGRS